MLSTAVLCDSALSWLLWSDRLSWLSCRENKNEQIAKMTQYSIYVEEILNLDRDVAAQDT